MVGWAVGVRVERRWGREREPGAGKGAGGDMIGEVVWS